MSDIISRQAVIDRFNQFVEACKEEHTGRVLFTIDDAKYAFIKTVESVESAHGEWVKWTETKEDDTGVTYIPHWKCSVCDTEYDPYFANGINYCPNCGAKMYKEAEE